MSTNINSQRGEKPTQASIGQDYSQRKRGLVKPLQRETRTERQAPNAFLNNPTNPEQQEAQVAGQLQKRMQYQASLEGR